MRTEPDSPDIVAARIGAMRIQHWRGYSLDAVLDALAMPGVLLKTSRKSATWRIGGCILKKSRFEGGLGPLKHTCCREHYRQAWRSAWRLRRAGVGVPAPLAFVEWNRFGFMWGNAMVSEYLDGARTVEQHAESLVQDGAARTTLDVFLGGLAHAVQALCASGARHADLSGKNILTRGGSSFDFIDLDSVILDQPYTEPMRLKNHIQLYDSFCDFLDDSYLGPFVQAMEPAPGYTAEEWFERVRQGQAERRARQIARWRRQGKEIPRRSCPG